MRRRDVDYSDIYRALWRLEGVCSVLESIGVSPRLSRRLIGSRVTRGITSPEGALPRFARDVGDLRSRLEQLFLSQITKELPQLPNEIIRMIFQFSQSAPSTYTVGLVSSSEVGRQCEWLQQQKLVILLELATISLTRCLHPRAHSQQLPPAQGNLSVHSLMKALAQDLRVWKSVLDPQSSGKDPRSLFSYFSKLESLCSSSSCVKPLMSRSSSVSCFLTKSSSRRGRHRLYSNPFSCLQQPFSLAPISM